jgi:hypothetical protein
MPKKLPYQQKLTLATPYGKVYVWLTDKNYKSYQAMDTEGKAKYLDKIQQEAISRAAQSGMFPKPGKEGLSRIYKTSAPASQDVEETTRNTLKGLDDKLFQFLSYGGGAGQLVKYGREYLTKPAVEALTSYGNRIDNPIGRLAVNIPASIVSEVTNPVSSFIMDTAPFYDPESTPAQRAKAAALIALQASGVGTVKSGLSAAGKAITSAGAQTSAKDVAKMAWKAYAKEDDWRHNAIDYGMNAVEEIKKEIKRPKLGPLVKQPAKKKMR